MTDTTRSTDHDMREALRQALRDWDQATPVQRTEAARQAMLLAEALAAAKGGTP